jgi:transglutaminase-like putative cysteine protease
MNRTPARLWDFLSAAFLILALLMAGQRLYITHWASGLGTAIILAILGVILGSAIGLSKFKRSGVFWLTLGYSIPIVILVLDWILYGGIPWVERVSNLSDHLAYSLGLFFTDQPVQDTTLFVVFMALVFWITGLMAGYALTRFGNYISTVVPAGVVFVIIQIYDPGKARGDALLAIYILFCLFLLGRLVYVQKQFFWHEQRVALLAESRSDLNINYLVIAVVAVLLVWLAPTSIQSFSRVKTAWEDLTHPLRDVQRDLGHAVAGLKGGRNARTVEFFGDALPLGQQATTGDSVYLRIRTPVAGDTDRYYWRVRSYNIFLYDKWYVEETSSTSFEPDHAPISLADPEGQTDEFVFNAVSVGLVDLVTPARPVWVSYPAELFFLQVPEGKMDPIQFRSTPTVLAGEYYSVRAKTYTPTILQLREAGDAYPDWVTSRYLQIPATISPEIVALAQRITEQAKTPYDMAVAITNYLRSNITYSDTVDEPPADRDLLDWFLFDTKQGFCNYYATAEVILLRSAGIPARLVVGFAQGELDPPNHYLVRQRDVHAWPEVYFPSVGWVEFEPTASQPPLPRQLDMSLSSGQGDTETLAGTSEQDGKDHGNLPEDVEIGINLGSAAFLNRLLRLIFIFSIIIAITRINPFGVFTNSLESDQRAAWGPLPKLIKRFLENRKLTPPGWLQRWAYLAELTPIEQDFASVYRSLHWLGEKPSPAQTPAEAAEALAERLPAISKEIYSLLYDYQRHLYSQTHGFLPLNRSSVKTIRQEALRVAIRQRWRIFLTKLTPGSHQESTM